MSFDKDETEKDLESNLEKNVEQEKDVNENKDKEKEKEGKVYTFHFSPVRMLANFMIFFAVFFFISNIFFETKPKEVSWSSFSEQIKEGKFEEVQFSRDSSGVFYQITGKVAKDKDSKETELVSSEFMNTEKNLSLVEKYANNTDTKIVHPSGSFGEIFNTIVSLTSLLFTGLLAFYLIRMIRGSASTLSGGKTEALDKSKSKITFANIAGKTEEKEELMDIISFFKEPEVYRERGLTIPRGILLEGAPGTGKTLLAKGLAGEIDANFYSVSGADFNGMFRGSGTNKVKSLFEEARKNAPSIIFIDEIDALAKSRGANINDKDSEQTLNQLLIELDGFDALDEQVVIIGATNLADSLDPAILRSGRFDRKVYVGLPNKKEREDILDYYLKDKKVNKDVDVKNWTEHLQGFSGADISSLVNEANLISYKGGSEEIRNEDLDKAFNKIVAGVEKKSTIYSPEQTKIVADHESGHAIVGALLEGGKKVKKVTIIPHGRSGGFAMMIPTDEMMVHTKEYVLNTIATLLGGRASEEILSNTQTSGVTQDVKEATLLARNMVTQYGMYGSLQQYDKEYINKEELSLKVDEILNSAFEQAKNTILENLPRTKLISKALLLKETLHESEIDFIVSLNNDFIKEKMDIILKHPLDRDSLRLIQGEDSSNLREDYVAPNFEMFISKDSEEKEETLEVSEDSLEITQELSEEVFENLKDI